MCSHFHKLAANFALMALSGCAPSGPGVVPPPGKIVEGNRQSVLQPGGPRPQRTARNPFEGDEEAIQTGKRLFSQFNCAGCHAAGGGAIGPALIDDQWTYGSSSENIFWTIIEGRPQGMPSFGGRISEDQAWRIVAFVRSIAGGLSRDEKSGVEAAP